MMEPEKTLLQQIREKEQEYAAKTDATKKETEAAIAAAEAEAESILCSADSAGKKEAEEIYWEERGKVEIEIGALKTEAATEREAAAGRGKTNLLQAVEAIVRSVTRE